MDIKENLAKNLCALRKSHKLTQLELAEILNYSDKAVSKWERGEAVPDLVVLKQIADYYGTTIDNLISEPKKDKMVALKNLPKKRLILSLLATVIVWLIATILYTFSNFISNVERNWLFFVFAVPLTNVILLVMWLYWGRTKTNFVISSILNWTILWSVYTALHELLISPPPSLWLMFIVGIPVQLLLVLVFLYKKIK